MVYPPISLWVDALTFLRSTSQGVEARQAPITFRRIISYGYSTAYVGRVLRLRTFLRNNRIEIAILENFPKILKVVSTANKIESNHRKLRKATKVPQLYPLVIEQFA